MAITLGKQRSFFYRDEAGVYGEEMALAEGSLEDPVRFVLEPPPGFCIYILGASMVILCDKKIQAQKFGTKNPLDNGIRAYLERSTNAGVMQVDFYDGTVVRQNGDFGNFASVSTFGEERGFQVSFGSTVPIAHCPGDRLVLEMRDDMTDQGIVSMRQTLAGVLQGVGEPFDA